MQEMTDFESSFLELTKAQSQRLSQQTHRKPRNAMEAFFESCSIRASELNKATQGWLQMQISVLLYNAENGIISPQTQTQAPQTQIYNTSTPQALYAQDGDNAFQTYSLQPSSTMAMPTLQ